MAAGHFLGTLSEGPSRAEAVRGRSALYPRLMIACHQSGGQDTRRTVSLSPSSKVWTGFHPSSRSILERIDGIAWCLALLARRFRSLSRQIVRGRAPTNSVPQEKPASFVGGAGTHDDITANQLLIEKCFTIRADRCASSVLIGKVPERQFFGQIPAA